MEITIKFIFDDREWGDYNDAHPDIIISDAFGELQQGIEYEVLNFKTNKK